MIFENKQPLVFNVDLLEIGYTKIRAAHNVPVDTDINSRVVWYKDAGAAKNTASRHEVTYEGINYVDVSGLSEGTGYDLSYSLVDDFAISDLVILEAQYQTAANIITITEQNSVTTKSSVSIASATNINNDQEQIGAHPSVLRMVMSGDATNVVIEATDNAWGSAYVIYQGSVSDGEVIDVTLAPGTYNLRATSEFIFANGEVDNGGTNVYGTAVSVSDSITAPADPSSIQATATKILDNVASYNLGMSWTWAIGAGGSKQNTLVSYMEFDGTISDLSTLDWTTATSEVALDLDHTFISVPYRKNLAVRVVVQGWNNNASSAVYREVFISENLSSPDNLETGYIVPVDGEALPDETKVYIDSRYISGFDSVGDKTFNFDAATGDVTIGKSGTYNGTVVSTPFQFDASAQILSISGQTITDKIVAADYVMGWLSGSAPQFRTSNRSSYGDGNEGIWMGYSDASTFQMDIGNATEYIRWDGANLRISGQVTIDGGSALNQLQKNVSYYKAATSTPNTPTGGTFASPTPTNEAGWFTYIPALGENDNAYMSQRLFTSDAEAPEGDWTTPGLFTTGGGEPGGIGPDGPRGPGEYYVETTDSTFPNTLAAAKTLATSSVPDSTPIEHDRVTIVNTETTTDLPWTLKFGASDWSEYALIVHGDVLVNGTVDADSIYVSGTDGSVEITGDNEELIHAKGKVGGVESTVFKITNTGEGELNGGILLGSSILPSALNNTATTDWLKNLIGATTASGGTIAVNKSVVLTGSFIDIPVGTMTHVSGSPMNFAASISSNEQTRFGMVGQVTPGSKSMSAQWYRGGVAQGSATNFTATAVQIAWNSIDDVYSWKYTFNVPSIPLSSQDPGDGEYTYKLRITGNMDQGIMSMGTATVIASVDEALVNTGVDLSDYTEKVSDQTLKAGTALTSNGMTVTLTKGDATTDVVNVPITDSVSTTNSAMTASATAVKAAYDIGNHTHPYAASNHTHPYAASNHTHGWSTLTDRPTTLVGYGITDAASSAHSHNLRDLTFGTSSNSGTAFDSNGVWLSSHTTGQTDVPGNYHDIINLSNGISHGIQIASGFGASSGHLYMRTRSDNPSAPNGVGLQPWVKLWHSGNDGTGSGLDADKLDGYDSGAFGKLSTTNTWTGTSTFNTGAMYPIEIKKSVNSGGVGIEFTDTSGDSQHGFITYYHSDSQSYGSANAFLYSGDQPSMSHVFDVGTNGSGLQARVSGTTHKIWHAGNDGASSGLDADKIRGIDFRTGDSSNAISPDNITVNGTSYINSVSIFGQTDGALYSQSYSSSWVHQIYGDYRTGNLAVRGKNGGSWQNWHTIWSSGNDGTGSGLDADLLDGAHGNVSAQDFTGDQYVRRHGSGYIFSNYFNMTANQTTSLPTRIPVETGTDKYLRWQTLADFRTNVVTKTHIDSLNVDADTIDGYDSGAFGKLSNNNTWSGTNTFSLDIYANNFMSVAGTSSLYILGITNELRMPTNTTTSDVSFCNSSDQDTGINFNGAGEMNLVAENANRLAVTQYGLRGERNGGAYYQEHSHATNASYHYGVVPTPAGAFYGTTQADYLGAIKIKLPVYGTYGMVKFEVDIFDYTTNESVKLLIAGYHYNGTYWNNQTVTNLTSNIAKYYNVRFGHDGTKSCVWIGETNSTWNYPQVAVTNVMVGFSDPVSRYAKDWEITFVTSFDTVGATISTDILPIAGGVKACRDGSAAAPVFSFKGDTDTGFYRTSSGVVGYSANNDLQLSFKSGTYGLDMNSYIDMNNNAIHYASEIHFNGSSKFTPGGNSGQIRMKSSGSATSGALDFGPDTSFVTKGKVYWNSSGFGLLDKDGSWAFRCNGSHSYLYDNSVAKLETTTTGVTVTGSLITTDHVQIGKYDTSETGSLLLTGSTANKQAVLKCTNGNLHIDANTGHNTYLNYYAGSQIYFGGGASNYRGTFTGSTGKFWSEYTESGAALSDLGYKGGFFVKHSESHASGTQTYYPSFGSTSKHNNGYRQHLSMGHKRNTAWDDAYIAIGGNDSYPTVEWLFSASGMLTTASLTATADVDVAYTLRAKRVEAGYNHSVDNSIGCSNWFRSSGQTGWYNGTYGGGIYMTDTTYVRTYASKRFHSSAVAINSFNTDGGIQLCSGGNYGYGVTGRYSATRFQGVFSMGAAYQLPADGTTSGNLYGIAWTHSNNTNANGSKISGHHACFMSNGVTKSAVGDHIWTSGNITSTNQYLAGNCYHTGDTNTYTGFHAAAQWRVVCDGTQRLNVNSSGVQVVGAITATSTMQAKGFQGTVSQVMTWDDFDPSLTPPADMEDVITTHWLAAGAVTSNIIGAYQVNAGKVRIQSGIDVDDQGTIVHNGKLAINIDPVSDTPISIARIRSSVGGTKYSEPIPIFSISDVDDDPDDPSEIYAGAVVEGKAGYKFCRTIDSISDRVKENIYPYYNGSGADVVTIAADSYITTETKLGTLNITGDADTYDVHITQDLSVSEHTSYSGSATNYTAPAWRIEVFRNSPSSTPIYDEIHSGTSYNDVEYEQGQIVNHYGGCSLTISLAIVDTGVSTGSTSYYIRYTRVHTAGTDTPDTIVGSETKIQSPNFIFNKLDDDAGGGYSWRDKETGFTIKTGRFSYVLSNRTASVTFEDSFTTIYSALASDDQSNPGLWTAGSVTARSASGLTVLNHNNSSLGIDWVAYGYTSD